MTTPEAVPKTFNEKDNKGVYAKWVRAINQMKDHVDPIEIEGMVAGKSGNIEETEIEILEIPLELEDRNNE